MLAKRTATQKPLRAWIIGTHDAASAVGLSYHAFRGLVDDGFIKPSRRKGCFTVGAVLDGYGRAVAAGRIKAKP